jgi:aspartokinase
MALSKTGKERAGKKVTARELVKEYVEERPSLFTYFLDGMLNVKALARKVKQETGTHKNEDALAIALHRLYEEVNKDYIWERSGGKALEKFLKETETNVYSDYAVAVLDEENAKSADAEVKVSFGNKTFIAGKRRNIEKYAKHAKFYKENLAVVELIHPEGAEDMPGIVFRVYWKLAEKGINIVETFSVWNVTYVVIEKEDLKKVVGLLV